VPEKERGPHWRASAVQVGLGSRRVWADQGERRSVTADRWHCAVVAPPQFESVTSLLDRYCLPPRPRWAIVFGEDELMEIDVLPIRGQGRFTVGGWGLMFGRLRL
jgi:hypothetical protein